LAIAVTASGHNNRAYASCPLSGHASLEVRRGALRLDGRRERPVLTVLGAGAFGVAALAAVIALSIVAAHFGFDLTRMRKGTTLIAVLALGAGLGGMTVGALLVEKVFGTVPYAVDITRDQLDAVAIDGKRVMIAWKATPGARASLLGLFPKDGDVEGLAAKIRGI
jgi:hypothetical protein